MFYSEENTRYVEKLSYVIQNGLIEELEKFIANEHEFPYGKLGPNVLRHQKNSCIIAVYQLSKDMMRDYCRRVRKLNRLHVSSPVIAQTVKYIHDHRMEKINAHIVAKTAGLSYSYLCSQLKKGNNVRPWNTANGESADPISVLLTVTQILSYIPAASVRFPA